MAGVLALGLLGCKSKPSGDGCEIANQKLMDMGTRATGKAVPPGALDEAIKLCHERVKVSETEAKDIACVVAAKDDQAIGDCMNRALYDSNTAPDGDPEPSGTSEPGIQLKKLGAALKVEYATDTAYPGIIIPLTPATACCTQPGKRCAPDPAAWQLPGWTLLEFAITEPSDFQYSLESTATGFKATAVGDPGCTGTPRTWVLEGSVAGKPPLDHPQLRWHVPAAH